MVVSPPSPRGPRRGRASMSDVISEPIPFEPPRTRPRIKKLRVLLVAIPLILLALVSAVFGMMMAFVADVISGKTVQGGSTITQQFVKNRLDAQGQRTVFEKLREAALAFHLARRWSKQKVLSQYLNSIYFGNGAYGIESAARTYFRNEPGHTRCGTQ